MTLAATLTWTVSEGAEGYTVEVASGAAFGPTLVVSSGALPAGTTSFVVPDGVLAAGKRYWWRVNATNAAGTITAANAPFSFTAVAVPGAFSLTTPADAATGLGTAPVLSWTPAAGAQSYTVEVGTNAAFLAPLVYSSSGVSGTATSFALPAATLAPATVYFWRVTAIDASGATAASNGPFSFTTNAPPGVFSLSSPAGDASGVDLTPTLSWSASAGAGTYTVDVATDAFFGTLVFSGGPVAAPATQVSVPEGALAAGGTYWWRVSALDNVGATLAVNAPLSFSTNTAPGAFTLSSPANGAIGVELAPTLSWSTSAGAVTYAVDVAADAGFTAIVFSSGPVAAPDTQVFVPGGTLSSGTTYYWRVTASDNVGTTLASNAPVSFTTLAPPGAFSLTSPANGAGGQSLTPALAWTASSAAARYALDVATDAGFGAIVYSSNSLTTPGISIPVGTLTAETTYWWRVSAINAAETTSADAPFSFTTMAPPGAFSLGLPSGGATGQATKPVLSWTASAGAASYTAVVGTTSNVAASAVSQATTSATSVQVPSALTPGATYFWQVTAENGGGSTGASNGPFAFAVSASAPGAFGPVSPAENATAQPLTPTLAWTSASAADSYAIEVSTNSSFSPDVLYASARGDATTVTVTAGALAPSTTYYWRVTATNAVGSTAASSVYSFTTNALPAAFTQLAPGNGTSGASVSSLFFGWNPASGAASYTLEIATGSGFGPSTVYTQTGLSTTVYPLPAGVLQGSTMYFWRVSAVDNVGPVFALNAPFQFTTAAPPAAFTLASPASGASGQALHPTLAWTATTCSTFSVDFASDAGFQSIAYTQAGISGSATGFTLPAGALAAGTSYFWRATAHGPGGDTIASNAPFILTTAAAAPSAFTLTAPASASTQPTLTPQFQWTDAEGETAYRLDVATDAGFATIVASVTVAADVTAALPPAGLTSGAPYFWRVVATNAFGETTASNAPFTVTVEDTEAWTPVTMTAAPAARFDHTAVWTGREMIVWGGTDNVSPMNTGGLYDPVADSWQATSTVGAPAARYGHGAVWTGRQMLVIGGGQYGYGYTDGGRYDPATDSWAPIAAGPAGNSGRFSTVWTGREMIVWGGVNANFTGVFNFGERYDPATDSWLGFYPSGDPNNPYYRADHVAVWTGKEMLIWGGYDYNGNWLTSGARFNPVAGTWATMSTTSAPPGASNSTAVWTGRAMLVFGGHVSASAAQVGFGAYDPATNAWMPASQTGAAEARYNHTALWTGREMVVWGGFGSNSSYPIGDGGRYDPATDTWAPTLDAGAPSARGLHAAVWTGTEMMVWGGFEIVNGHLVVAGDGARYRRKYLANEWAPIAAQPAGIAGPPFATPGIWTGYEMILWGGGYSSNPSTGAIYDPVADSWAATSDSTSAGLYGRTGHSIVWTGAEMIVVGGGNSAIADGVGARYDPILDSWRAIAATPHLSFTPAVWTGREVVFTGGANGGGGGRYDPTSNTWSPISTVNAPTPAAGMSGVWDGRELIIWGGWSHGSSFGQFFSHQDGGRYDPVADAWTPIAVTGAPAARDGQSAVWTGREMIIWGGGQFGTGGPFNDGGRYDPRTDTWMPISTVNAPTARSGTAEPFTGIWTGARLLIFGGVDANGYMQDAGLYDPIADVWSTPPSANQPEARGQQSSVRTDYGVIIFGGAGTPISGGANILNNGAVLR